MSRPSRLPAYKLHKPSGLARVIVAGRHVYLGPFGSPQSRLAYSKLIAEQTSATGAATPPEKAAPAPGAGGFPDLSINELLLKYLQFAESYYTKNGKPTGELHNLKDAMRTLRTLYSHTLAREFGPKALKRLQQHMIEQDDLSRRVINARINRIRRIFKWAVSDELIPPATLEALRSVAGLRLGRCNAREAPRVMPVADALVETTLPFLPPIIADMVRVQRLTSMRPGDVVRMRPCDLDRNGKVWIYEPHEHKMDHLERRRLIPIGPRAQRLLEPYLTRSPSAYLFTPAEVLDWRRAEKRRTAPPRGTKVYPCELRRLAREKAQRAKQKPLRVPGERYTTHSYHRSIQDAIDKANKSGVKIDPWHANQLRHSRATEVRRDYGLEGAQVVLGHASANITEIYAERDLELAKRIARKTG